MSEPVTLVHLVRHGEVHNPGKVLYGRLPGFGLSVAGRRMAVVATAFLAGRDVVGLWSSPLERAQQTAAPLAAAFDLPVRLDDRLLESASHFEGRTVAGARSFLDPAAWPLLANPFRPSWGEPYAEVAARMMSVVADARDGARGHEAVLVTHQLPVYVLRRHVEGRPLWHRPDRRQCALASVTTLRFAGERIVGVTYAEPAGHAEQPGPPGA